MINTQDEVDAFFDVNDPGRESIQYVEYGAASKPIVVIWDEQYAATSVEGLEAMNFKPNALCRSVDVPNATDKDTVVRNSQTYYVIDVRPDGTGITRLIFSKDAP